MKSRLKHKHLIQKLNEGKVSCVLRLGSRTNRGLKRKFYKLIKNNNDL
jgi:hypothetical protein